MRKRSSRMSEDLWGFEKSAGNKSIWDAYKRGVYWVSGVLGRVKESRELKIANEMIHELC